jgi:hypothetical protein
MYYYILITISQYQVLAAKSQQLLDFHADLVSLDAASKVCVSSFTSSLWNVSWVGDWNEFVRTSLLN